MEALCRHAEFLGLQTHRRSRQKGQHDGGGMGGSHPDQGCPEEDEKLLRRQQPSGRCIPGGGSTGGIRSSQTFRPFIISALFCPPQAAAINPGGHGIPLMSRLPAGFLQRAVPRRASPGAGNTDLLCCAPNQLFSCLPFSKSSISVDCESIILSTAFSRLLFPAFGPRESGSAVCSRRLRQDGASGQPGAGPGKEPCSGRIHALYIRIPRPPWKNAAGTAVPEKYPHHHGIGSGTGKN